MLKSTPESMELLASWREGARLFNHAEYWEAHHFWERGWVSLEPCHKAYVQSLILACGAFHLFGKGREEPARRLCQRALQRFEDAGAARRAKPRVVIRGLPSVLKKLCAEPEAWPEIREAKVKFLKARLLL